MQYNLLDAEKQFILYSQSEIFNSFPARLRNVSTSIKRLAVLSGCELKDNK